jgi:two-component system, cell cycle response regulator DivK
VTESAQPLPVGDSESRDFNAPRTRRPPRVLIVDDSWDATEMYGTYLVHAGYQSLTAADGFAGVQAARGFNPDVVVMDLAMPRMDGIKATQTLKHDRHTRHIPVILLTGYPERAIGERGLEAGADVFLTKPCLPEDLEHHIRRLLPARRK